MEVDNDKYVDILKQHREILKRKEIWLSYMNSKKRERFFERCLEEDKIQIMQLSVQQDFEKFKAIQTELVALYKTIMVKTDKKNNMEEYENAEKQKIEAEDILETATNVVETLEMRLNNARKIAF